MLTYMLLNFRHGGQCSHIFCYVLGMVDNDYIHAAVCQVW